MNTERLMEIALAMTGLSEVPGDSAVHHAGQGIRRLLVSAIDPMSTDFATRDWT